ncbi:hypothetical protein C2G38_2201704 [Gigaspora rosea]|uniref:MD-2-related lipid-recognition domain-containing protein n=1 Tax=Gigaspora rosea TaxID=44941 RepID=A0A397UQH3_9GLOM|nr:hypothetical protein C2G38_2201704 [Gigaspora rosea]
MCTYELSVNEKKNRFINCPHKFDSCINIFTIILTTSFEVNANPGWSDCSFNAIGAPVVGVVFFGPDPIGPAGTILQVNVTQSLSKPTTQFTKLIIEFTDAHALPKGYTRHPLDTNIVNIEDTFLAVVPQFLPDKYLIRVMVIEAGSGEIRNCVLFHRP